MPITERQRILLQFTAARDHAESLLRVLLEARAQSEKHLAEVKQPDAMKRVTGRSSIDNAVASTQRMIESINRNIGQIERELSDEDLALLNESRAGG